MIPKNIPSRRADDEGGSSLMRYVWMAYVATTVAISRSHTTVSPSCAAHRETHVHNQDALFDDNISRIKREEEEEEEWKIETKRRRGRKKVWECNSS